MGNVEQSDSESSVASEIEYDANLKLAPDVHAFADRPHVSAEDLMVHKISGIVHVANEDDYFACGRKTSHNYQQYVNLASFSHHFEACAQCKRALRNAGN